MRTATWSCRANVAQKVACVCASLLRLLAHANPDVLSRSRRCRHAAPRAGHAAAGRGHAALARLAAACRLRFEPGRCSKRRMSHACACALLTPPAGRRFKGATVLELGAGTGLVSLLCAQRCRCVFATDVGAAVLANCARNLAAAAPRFAHGPHAARVRHLDWAAPPPWTEAARATNASTASNTADARFAWSAADVAQLASLSEVLVADCVYDDALTDALWATLRSLFAHCPSLRGATVSLERRVNFSAQDLTGARCTRRRSSARNAVRAACCCLAPRRDCVLTLAFVCFCSLPGLQRARTRTTISATSSRRLTLACCAAATQTGRLLQILAAHPRWLAAGWRQARCRRPPRTSARSWSCGASSARRATPASAGDAGSIAEHTP
jgi:predicted nicotinamide N-methyase